MFHFHLSCKRLKCSNADVLLLCTRVKTIRALSRFSIFPDFLYAVKTPRNTQLQFTTHNRCNLYYYFNGFVNIPLMHENTLQRQR